MRYGLLYVSLIGCVCFLDYWAVGFEKAGVERFCGSGSGV